MKNDKKKHFKDKLLKIRSELAGEVEKNRQYSHEDSGEVPDINDDAARTYSRSLILQLGEREREQLKEVDESLEMIESGEYGLCVECGEDIPEKRLELIPYAKLCITCKEKVEAKEKTQ
ncbi:MAG: TraR/DksA family transcriptional regulator [Nitrospinae bacterium]|nr:TraR/DksA family transcriptional regulator [Nitrospinota bacterium]MBI3815215.1 TraR/DksA family transcriptional regulator [Nitrospinota bacterium]